MTIVVTGGAGFIGSNFIHYIRKACPQTRIVCVDKLTYAGSMDNLAGVAEGETFRFVCADIGDGAAMRALLTQEKPDAVVNFAAESHVDRSIEGPGVFMLTNVLGVQTLLDACLDSGCRRFHQVSTDEVYGDLPLKGGAPFTEDSPLRPSSPYAASKASADLIALAYYRTYGLHVTISRCSNNYGPRQYPEKLIPLMVRNAARGLPLPVYGTGENVRDWLHVLDHCEAVRLILERGESGRVYNAGGGLERSNLEIVRMILEETGAPQTLMTFVPDRKGHDLRYAVDTSRIMRELGWRAAHTSQESLRETVRGYLIRHG